VAAAAEILVAGAAAAEMQAAAEANRAAVARVIRTDDPFASTNKWQVETLRPDCSNDMEQCNELARVCFPTQSLHLATECAAPQTRAWIARSASTRTASSSPSRGFLLGWRIVDDLHILYVATALEYRRQGIARHLIKHACQAEKQTGATQALLEVREQNTAAVHLYRSYGFGVCRTRLRYYDDGENALEMSCLIE